MLLRCIPLLLALLALCALSVEARPMRGTILSRRLTVEERSLPNAERLKRGLPPRAPALGRVFPGREELEPTPASKAKRGSPSPSAVASVFTGRIEVKLTNGTVIGLVNDTDTGFFSVDIGGTAGTDLEVKIATTTGGGPFSLLATNPTWTGPPFVGGGSNDTLTSGSVAVVPFAVVPQTIAGAAPGPQGASAIWTVNPKTLRLTPKWTNLNGSTITPTIGYQIPANLLFFSGDIKAFNGLNNNTAVPVEFFLIK